MSWPVPTPDVIAGRAAAVYEGTPALAGIDARSAVSVAAANCRALGMSAFDLYLYQGSIALDLMPDTATDWLDRQGSIWGVPRQPPRAAIGFAVFSGPASTPVPAGIAMTSAAGQSYATTAATVIGSSGTVSAPTQASLAGSAGNAAPGVTLTLVSPVLGLSAQNAVVDSGGIAGGTDLQSDDDLRAAILARIRQPPNGGAANDYVTWAKGAGAGYVNVAPGWVGGGSVGVIVAMPGSSGMGPAVPTTAELAAIDTVLQANRPVTAEVITVAASLTPVPVTIHLNPDTTAIRLAAQNALTLFFAQDGAIGGTIFVSRLDDGLSNADGEFSHERTVPAADVVLTAAQMPVLGTLTFA